MRLARGGSAPVCLWPLAGFEALVIDGGMTSDA
jgi:hypothetical protein